MPVSIAQHESHRLIRLEGRVGIASSGELKSLLLDWIASGTNLQVDLERTEEIDLTVLQLLWAAGRDAAERGIRMVSRPSEAAERAARDAGFDGIPGSATPFE